MLAGSASSSASAPTEGVEGPRPLPAEDVRREIRSRNSAWDVAAPAEEAAGADAADAWDVGRRWSPAPPPTNHPLTEREELTEPSADLPVAAIVPGSSLWGVKADPADEWRRDAEFRRPLPLPPPPAFPPLVLRAEPVEAELFRLRSDRTVPPSALPFLLPPAPPPESRVGGGDTNDTVAWWVGW